MIALDTNILVLAHSSGSKLHEQAERRLCELAEGREPWGIPAFCLGEFVRVTTHSSLPSVAFTAEEACEALERLLSSPTATVLLPGQHYWSIFRDLVGRSRATGNRAFDAQIAALCIETGVRCLVTEDRDFKRFDDLPIEHLS